MTATTDVYRPAILPRLRASFLRVMEFLAACSAAAACSREVERLLLLSDEELAARGLTRDRIVHHAFARSMRGI